MTQHYELLFITSIKLSEQERATALKKVSDLITQAGGQIGQQDSWGNRKLAYEINHEANGFYTLIEFDLEVEKLKKIDVDLRLMPEVVRYLITKKRVKTEADLVKEKMIQEKVAAKRVAAETKKEEEKKKEVDEEKSKEEKPKLKDKDKKISLDDLDKKLDEILKEEL